LGDNTNKRFGVSTDCALTVSGSTAPLTHLHPPVARFAVTENDIHDLSVSLLQAYDVDGAPRSTPRAGSASAPVAKETCLTKDQVEDLLKVKAANDNFARRLDALERKAGNR
jgi:hypothetical protein